MANPAVIEDYAGLKNAIEDHLIRTDTDDEGVSAMCIDLAEARFNRELRTVDMLTHDTAFTVSAQYVALPSGFLEARRFVLLTSPVTPLEPLTLEEISQKRQSLSSSSRPAYYAVIGTSFEFLPTPGDTYTGDLLYYKRLTSLTSVAPTNWLIISHPDVYLFACLVEASNYFHDHDQAAMWEGRLQQALSALRMQDGRARIGGTPVARAKAF